MSGPNDVLSPFRLDGRVAVVTGGNGGIGLGMAEGLAAVGSDTLVIGVMGSGHLEGGQGVPHQLADLGVGDSMVLLPWDQGRDCAELSSGLADAVFGIAPSVFTHPELRVPVVSVYLDKKKSITDFAHILGTFSKLNIQNT